MEDKEKRRRRNARYRLKRKQIHTSKVVSLFSRDDTGLPINNSGAEMVTTFQTLLLGCLCFALTTFLLTETSRYFAEMEGGGTLSVLKAVLCEGVIIAFSLLTAEHIVAKCLHKFVLIGMCLYSLWAISSNVLMQAHRDYREHEAARISINDLQTEIQTQDTLIEKYLALERISVATRLQAKRDVSRQKLFVLRQNSTSLKPPQIVLNTVFNLVFFRLLVMLANILSVRRLSKQIKANWNFGQMRAATLAHPLRR